MTDVQLQYCKKCLNRKNGVITQENNCNLKGFNTEFEGVCSSFDLDDKVIIGAGTRSNEIRPNDRRASLAQTLIWSVMILNIISIYSSYLQYNLLVDLQNNEGISDSIINTNDTREQYIAIVYLIVYIISGFTFIQWFRRAYYNLNLRINCENTEGWASWSWFVPIISIFRPYQIMKEMNDKTIGLLKSNASNIITDNSQLIGIWWAIWVLSNYLGKIIFKYSFKADTIENLINLTLTDIVLSFIGIPLAIITVQIIKSHAIKEETLSEIEKKNQ